MSSRLRVRRSQVLSVCWLTVVWLLLWGSVTPLTVAGGLLVGLAVTVIVRLPPVPDRLPFRPLQLLALAGYLLYDLTVSTVEVAWQALHHGRDARAAVVGVPLLTGSDQVITLVANAVTLSPGTTVFLIDRERGVWYFYTLGPRNRDGVESARRRAMDMQRRVLAALGSPAEIAEAQRWLEDAR